MSLHPVSGVGRSGLPIGRSNNSELDSIVAETQEYNVEIGEDEEDEMNDGIDVLDWDDLDGSSAANQQSNNMSPENQYISGGGGSGGLLNVEHGVNVMVEELFDDQLSVSSRSPGVSPSNGKLSNTNSINNEQRRASDFEAELDKMYDDKGHVAATAADDIEDNAFDDGYAQRALERVQSATTVGEEVSNHPESIQSEEEENEYLTNVEDEDEESVIPPPPPSSPPPTSEDGIDLDEEDETITPGDDHRRLHRRSTGSHNATELFDDVIYSAGLDKDGCPIVVFLPRDARTALSQAEVASVAAGGRPASSRYDEISKEENRLVEFCARTLGELAAKGPYILVIATGGKTNELVSKRELLSKLILVTKKFPRSPHRKNLRKLIVLQPDPICISVLFALKRVLSPKFWKKLSFVKRVSDLDAILQPSSSGETVSLPLPEDILQFDISEAVQSGSLFGGGAAVNRRQSALTGGSEVEGSPPTPSNNRQFAGRALRAESEATTLMSHYPANFSSYWQIGSTFGCSLGGLAVKTPFGLPPIVQRCVTYLCMHGVKVPGIFRVPGNADMVSSCKRKLEAGVDVDLGGYWSSSGRPATVEDVHICAALLKSFFRELPKPILTHAAYTSLMRTLAEMTSTGDAKQDQDSLLAQMKEILQLLPKQNKALLQYISFFCQYIMRHDEFNHMTASNLAIVWVPNLFRDELDPNDPTKELKMLPHAMKACLTMFTHTETLFPIDDGTILPPCMSMETGRPLKVDVVCSRDVTNPDLANMPLAIEEREFDQLIPKKILPRSSFILHSAVSSLFDIPPGGLDNTDPDDHDDYVSFVPGEFQGSGRGTDSFATNSAAVRASFNANIGNGGEGLPEPQSVVLDLESAAFITPSSVAELDSLSIRDLKRYLIKNGYDPTNCLEKRDLRKMALNCYSALHGIPVPMGDDGATTGKIKPPPPPVFRRSLSLDSTKQRWLATNPMQPEISTASTLVGEVKRNSDLGRRDRKDSDFAFASILRQAGVTNGMNDSSSFDGVDAFSERAGMSTDSERPNSNSNGQNNTPSTGASTKRKSLFNLTSYKRDFSQVNNGSGSPSSSSSPQSGGGTRGSLLPILRRKSSLTRENKRDLSKSAKGIGSGGNGGAHLNAPTPPLGHAHSAMMGAGATTNNVILKRKLSRNTSSNESPQSHPSDLHLDPLEETVRALKETPLFGEMDALDVDQPGSSAASMMMSNSRQSRSDSETGSATGGTSGGNGIAAQVENVLLASLQNRNRSKATTTRTPSPSHTASNMKRPAPTAAVPSSEAALDVTKMSIKELKAAIISKGKTHSDCFTIEDLRSRAEEALGLL